MSEKVKACLRRCAEPALAACVVTLFAGLFAPIIWKLSQQTLFYADWAGLKDLVSSETGRPGGLLLWLARGVQVTGLGSFVLLPYALAAAGTVWLWRRTFPTLRGGAWPLVAFLASFLCVIPAIHAGTALWMLDDYASGFRNVLGLWTACGVYLLARRTRVWLAALIAVVLTPWLGVYPLLGVIAANFYYLPLLAVPLVIGSFGYYDIAWNETLLMCGSIFDRLRFCSLNVWNAAVFVGFFVCAFAARHPLPAVRLPQVKAKFKLVLLALGGVGLCVAMYATRPLPDLRGQMARERAVVEGRWEDVLKVQSYNENTLRMETAYRVLALQRLDRLPEALFDEPHWSTQDSTDAQENLMDGHELLFAYGLLLPARRYMYETMSTKNWMPRHFHILGDIAFLFGENALAEKNYFQLQRCPYYRGIAASRLRDLYAGKLPAELEIVANLARTVNQMLTENKVEFFDIEQNCEQLAYNHFINVKNCDAQTARFCLSCMLLKKKHDVLALNGTLIESLFKTRPGGIPESIYQALLVSGKVPANMFPPQLIQKYQAYLMARQRVTPSNQGDFLKAWANNYFFYNDFVK